MLSIKDRKKLFGYICSIVGLCVGGAILLYLLHFVTTTMDVRALLAAIQPGWLVGAGLCVPVAITIDGLIFYIMGRGARCPVRLRGCMDAAFIGEFYYKLGPAGAPVQLGLMHSAGMPPAATASVYTWKLVANTLVYTGYALAALAFKLLVQGGDLGLALVGVSLLVGLYVLMCGAVLLFIWRPAPMIALLTYVLTALSRLIRHLGVPGRVTAIVARVEEFRDQLQALRRRRVLGGLFLLMLVEITALFSIPFFLYNGLGLTGHSYADLLLTQCLVMVLSRVVMLPGNAGGAEGSFYLFMTPIFGAALPVGLVLWRCTAFLEVLLLGGVCSIFRFISQSLEQRKEAAA